MTELLDVANAWPAFALALLIFGFLPGFVLRIMVRLYPPEDPRRAELVAELYALSRLKRPMWVAEQIETALFEGPKARRTARQARRANAPARKRGRLLASIARGLIGFVAVLRHLSRRAVGVEPKLDDDDDTPIGYAFPPAGTDPLMGTKHESPPGLVFLRPSASPQVTPPNLVKQDPAAVEYVRSLAAESPDSPDVM